MASRKIVWSCALWRCTVVHVARTGSQNAIKIERTVQEYLNELKPNLPEDILDIWNNRANTSKSDWSL